MGSSISSEVDDPIPEGPPGPDRSRAYYWTKPNRRGLSQLSTLLPESCGSSCASSEHWLVAFEYEDEVIVCDAVKVDGELTGRYRSKEKDEFHKDNSNKKYLGEYNIPKEIVKDAVKNMMKYGSYDPLSNNCQKWLKDLLKSVEVDISRLSPDAKTSFFSVMASAFAVGATFGAFMLSTS